jgi:hypothetical protein
MSSPDIPCGPYPQAVSPFASTEAVRAQDEADHERRDAEQGSEVWQDREDDAAAETDEEGTDDDGEDDHPLPFHPRSVRTSTPRRLRTRQFVRTVLGMALWRFWAAAPESGEGPQADHCAQ